jgi:hypothetical protein
LQKYVQKRAITVIVSLISARRSFTLRELFGVSLDH